MACTLLLRLGGLHARLQTEAQRASCKKSDVGNSRPNPAPDGSPDTKQGKGFLESIILEPGRRRRGLQRCEVAAIGGEIVESWVLGGKGRVVPSSGGPHHCYGTAPLLLLLLREPTLYYARHSPGHTHACTATPLFHGNPARECSPHYQMFARVAKLRVSQNLGGHHLDEGQLRELQIWPLLSSSSGLLAEADSPGAGLLAFSGWC